MGCSSNPTADKKIYSPPSLRDYYLCMAQNRCSNGSSSSLSYDRNNQSLSRNEEIIKEQLYNSFGKQVDIVIKNNGNIKNIFFEIKNILNKNKFKIVDSKDDFSYMIAESEPSTTQSFNPLKWEWKELYFVVVHIFINPRDNTININYLIDYMEKLPLSNSYESRSYREKEKNKKIKKLIEETKSYILRLENDKY